MKMLKNILAITLCVTLLFGICGCSALKGGSSFDVDAEGAPMPPMIGSSGGSEDFSDSFYPDSYPDYGESDITSGTDYGTTEDVKPSDDEATRRPAGLITAGAWDDNKYYEEWKKLFDQASGENAAGKFVNYAGTNSWDLYSIGRIKVTVGLESDDNARVAGAEVVARDAYGKTIFTAVTDATGVAYLFVGYQSCSLTVTSGDHTATEYYTAELDPSITVKLDGCAEKKNTIDIMFVVDVTGSMGDELYFLKNELADVINKVATGSADASINLALLFYRDDGDAKKFTYCDFTDVTSPEGLAAIQSALDKESADGGGDYPEAVDEALELAVSKQWNSAATTKLIFHVLDAPPHSKAANIARYKGAVEAAAAKGIRICPILCSGAENLTEYLVRQAAIYTGGTFIYVTDDSGIGGTHHDPDLPNVTVELLNSLLVRIIKGYHSGEFAPPVYWKTDKANNQ